MKKHTLTFLSILFSFCLQAQNGIFSGVILDSSTAQPLIGATILLDNGDGASSDLDGSFSITTEAGSHQVTVSYVGYTTWKGSVDVTDAGEVQQNIYLREEAGLLNTIVVTGSKFEKRLGEETVSMDVLKTDIIENTNDVKIDQTLQRLPGVNVIDGQANIRGGSGYSYGAGSRVLLLMDDLPMLTGDAAFSSWDFIPIENIQQVEVIKGASSALYGSSALNGIINVRTAYPGSAPETRINFFNGVYFAPRDTAQKWWGDNYPFAAGASFLHKQKFGKFDLVTGAYVMNQDSYLKDIYNRRARANINTRYRINNNLAIGLNTNAQWSRSSTFFFWSSIDTGLYIPYPNTIAINRGFKVTVDPYLNYYDKQGNRHKLLLRYYGNHNATLTTEQSNFNDLYYGEYQYQKHFDASDLVLTGGITGSYASVSAEIYGDSLFHSSNEAVVCSDR
ncbi:MAG: TonB-dependent receptor plug domain-containing protein [Chitinophagales bacterium]